MDFEKSTINININKNNINFIKNIQKFMDNLCDILRDDINIKYDNHKLRQLQKEEHIDYIQLNNVIDTLTFNDD
jgi:hypothetical protein